MQNYGKYIGLRYVPIFDGEWNVEKEYEPLVIVTNAGSSYTSKKSVPKGTRLTDDNYWVCTGNYNMQMELLTEQINDFSTRIDQGLSEKADKTMLTRKFSSNTEASIWLAGADIKQGRKLVDDFKKLGFDGLTIIIHVDGDENCSTTEDINVVRQTIEYAREKGMKVDTVKFHNTKEELFTSTTMQDAYSNKILEVLRNFTNIHKVFVFNEREELSEPYSGDFVENVINRLQSQNYEVGISFAGTRNLLLFLNKNQYLHDRINLLGLNVYPNISAKDHNATLEESITAWKEVVKEVGTIKELSTKRIEITETGVAHFWQALRKPADWTWYSFSGSVDGKGGPACLYLKGMFESGIDQLVSNVSVWYPEQMVYDEVRELIYTYTKGGK